MEKHIKKKEYEYEYEYKYIFEYKFEYKNKNNLVGTTSEKQTISIEKQITSEQWNRIDEQRILQLRDCWTSVLTQEIELYAIESERLHDFTSWRSNIASSWTALPSNQNTTAATVEDIDKTTSWHIHNTWKWKETTIV